MKYYSLVQQCRFIAMLLAALASAACTEVPRYSAELVKNFSDNKILFVELEEAFEVSGAESMSYSPSENTVNVQSAINGPSSPLGSSSAARVRELMTKTLVYRVQKAGNGTRFELISRKQGSRTYFQEYAHRVNTRVSAECTNSVYKSSKGECFYRLDPEWNLEMRWYTD